jgi:outer membrane protein OmpA-like peptidoglycan-associated protein
MRKALAIIAVSSTALSACQSMDESQQRTAKSTGIGAAAGAAIGAVAGGSDHRAGGAAIGAAVGALGGYAWNQRMENQRKQIETATQGTGIEVAKTQDNRLRIVVPDNISFDTGRAVIKPDFRSMLDRFAQSLSENPQTLVQIVGHTDSTGNDAANAALSRERAVATRDHLVTRGVSMNRIAVDGRGAREPVASNDSEAGRARNRRVEIFLHENAA